MKWTGTINVQVDIYASGPHEAFAELHKLARQIEDTVDSYATLITEATVEENSIHIEDLIQQIVEAKK